MTPMPKGEKLFRFLASLILREFYATATIRFERGKLSDVGIGTCRAWRYALRLTWSGSRSALARRHAWQTYPTTK